MTESERLEEPQASVQDQATDAGVEHKVESHESVLSMQETADDYGNNESMGIYKEPEPAQVTPQVELAIAAGQEISSASTSLSRHGRSGLPDGSLDPVRGGAPVRRYLNQQVTPVLLEGMKLIARERPDNPLEVLGRFLIERSKEGLRS
ncbi:Dpy-30 motif-domain-containing protein [Lipomyces japonicus]|uniref:Dpy-30 motif-domain-containing protein n=1 Tax=Lipomyces japonicus TaxID=56871 RepID=UPI0034D00511